MSGVQYGPGPSPNQRTRRAMTSAFPSSSSFARNVIRDRPPPWTTVLVASGGVAVVERRPAVRGEGQVHVEDVRDERQHVHALDVAVVHVTRVLLRPFHEQRHGHDARGRRAAEPLHARTRARRRRRGPT